MSQAIPDRLRIAIGDRTLAATADASRVAIRTITRILAGEETRRSTLVRLARALDVREEWLIDGNGPIRDRATGPVTPDGYITAVGPMMPFERSEAPLANLPKELSLFQTLNMDRAATALSISEVLFSMKSSNPTHRERVQAMAIVYDMLTENAESQAAQTAPETAREHEFSPVKDKSKQE